MRAHLVPVPASLHRAPAPVPCAGEVEEHQPAVVSATLANPVEVRAEHDDGVTGDGRHRLMKRGGAAAAAAARKPWGHVGPHREPVDGVDVRRAEGTARRGPLRKPDDGCAELERLSECGTRACTLSVVPGDPAGEPSGDVARRPQLLPLGTPLDTTCEGEIETERASIEEPAGALAADEPLPGRRLLRIHVTIIVGYMDSPVGLTRDVGWNMGVRRTVDAPLEDVWDHLVGVGLATWLGVSALPAEPGGSYEADDGTTGDLRTWTERRRLRLTWRPPELDHDTTLQVTVLPAARGTTIAFHQERMTSADERATMLEHWTGVVERLVAELTR